MKLDNQSKRVSSDEAGRIWRDYRRTGDAKLRDRLVLTYAPLVKYLAYRKARELPARCEVAELVSCGFEALIAAVDRYDPAKGATLEQFAWTRIHGAILDELRRQDWAPRSLRRWERDIARARELFSANHGRPPTAEELAGALGVGVAQLRRHEHDIAASDVTSLNSLVLADEETAIERIETVASADAAADPESSSALNEAKEKFREAFAELPQREREVAVLLYVKELTLREIGETLGVSESRVCQIHGQLKRRLRERLRSDEVLFSVVA